MRIISAAVVIAATLLCQRAGSSGVRIAEDSPGPGINEASVVIKTIASTATLRKVPSDQHESPTVTFHKALRRRFKRLETSTSPSSSSSTQTTITTSNSTSSSSFHRTTLATTSVFTSLIFSSQPPGSATPSIPPASPSHSAPPSGSPTSTPGRKPSFDPGLTVGAAIGGGVGGLLIVALVVWWQWPSLRRAVTSPKPSKVTEVMSEKGSSPGEHRPNQNRIYGRGSLLRQHMAHNQVP